MEKLREKCPNTEVFLVRIFPHSDSIQTRKNSVFGDFSRSESDNCTNNYLFLIGQAHKTVLMQIVTSEKNICDQNDKPSNPRSHIPSTYGFYFHTLLIIQLQDPTFDREPVA